MNNIQGGHVTCYICEVQALAPQFSNSPWTRLTHLVCARSRKGKFTVHVRTMKKRFRRGLKAIAEWCQENRHMPVEEQQKTLNAKLRGHYQYYGRPTNYRTTGVSGSSTRRSGTSGGSGSAGALVETG